MEKPSTSTNEIYFRIPCANNVFITRANKTNFKSCHIDTELCQKLFKFVLTELKVITKPKYFYLPSRHLPAQS